MTIRNPIEWGVDLLRATPGAVSPAGDIEAHAAPPTIRRIGLPDLRAALAAGFADFGAVRLDVLVLGVLYPLVGLLLARLAFGDQLLPLVFPLASGFALLGPFAAIGMMEISRRRELGQEVNWLDALAVRNSPSFGSILMVGLALMALFLAWLVVAWGIYDITLGPAPRSTMAFVHDVFATRGGWALILLGCGIGFCFAVAALAIGAVSFPLLLDRPVGAEVAVWSSLRAVAANPVPMAAWGLIVAVGLAIGSVPFLLGLAVVLPVLGHATWHLYRRLVAA